MALPVGITALPDWFYYTLLGGTILAMLFLAAIIVIFMWTPAGAFMKAKFKRLPIFLMAGRDAIGGFFVPEFSENQYAHFKKAGTYAITRESFIFDRKSKQPIYIADKDIGASINKEWPKILEQILEHFPMMKTGVDYKKVIQNAIDNKNDALANPKLILKGSTIKISELAKFFPMNIKPTYIDEYAMIAVRRDRRKQNAAQFWILASVLIICVGIAGYLLIGKANEGRATTQCSCDCGNIVEKVCGMNAPGLQKVNGTMQVVTEVKPDAPKESSPGAKLS